MILKLKRTPGIYVVGFMAAGKTTIGRLLADELGWGFADIDEDIETSEGMKIADIFDQRGEEEFRRIESEAIRKRVVTVKSGRPLVVALGGGAFGQPANYELVEEHGVTMWLDCPFNIVEQRVARASHRPLARNPEHFRALYETRRPAYERADFRIPVVSDDPAVAVGAILALPIF